MFLHPVIPQPQVIDGFLYKVILNGLQIIGKNLPFTYPIITYFFLFTQALSINKFVNNQKLLQKPSYLAAMTYLLVTSFFSQWNVFSSVLIINSIIIFILFQITKLNESRSANGTLLNIGLLTGIGTFIYFPSVAFFILIVVGVVLIRRFNIKEWFMVLIGVLTPYYFLLAYVFIADMWRGYHFPGFAIQIPFLEKSGWTFAGITIIAFACVIGLYLIQNNYRRFLIQTRKSWSLVYFYLLISFFVPFINTNKSFSYWVLMAVPASIISSACFVYPLKKWIPKLFHLLMIAFIVAMYFFKS